ncbi:MAG: hemolysin III family protein [Candidatus Velamenicoccus archaeovorus]
MDTPSRPLKPRLRGRIHEIAFFVSVPAGGALVALAAGPVARVGALVYAISLSAVFGASAAYHRGDWSARALRRMKRLDHSMIFVLIAGSYTPVALLVLHGAWSVVILSIVWAGAATGVVLKLARIDGLSVPTGILYIALGWLAVIALPQLLRGMSPLQAVLMLLGGVLYTVGAVVFAIKRPDPSPSVFGFHEVWHAFMVGAAACHFAMIALVVRVGM